MIVSPKKKVYRALWIIIGLLFVLMLLLVFKLLLGPNRWLFGVGVVLDLVLIIFLYIKSVLNYFLVKVVGNEIKVEQFGRLLGSAKLKEVKFGVEKASSGKGNYQRIFFDLHETHVVVSNFEHDFFDDFHQLLVKNKLLVKKV